MLSSEYVEQLLFWEKCLEMFNVEQQVHLTDFLLENSRRLVATYHPHGRLCIIRIINENDSVYYRNVSLEEISIIYVYDSDEKLWIQQIPNEVRTHIFTLAQELCMAVAFAMYAHPESLDRTAAMDYFKRERSNFLWQRFLDEVKRQQIVASAMVI